MKSSRRRELTRTARTAAAVMLSKSLEGTSSKQLRDRYGILDDHELSFFTSELERIVAAIGRAR